MYRPIQKDGSNNVEITLPLQSKFAMQLFGSWPLAKPNNPPVLFNCCYLLWSITLIILVGCTCYFQASYMFNAWGDLLTVTECGCTTLMGLHNLLRLIDLCLKRNKLKDLISKFTEYIWISSERAPEMYRKCEKEANIMKYISCLLFVLICMYVILPLYELINNFDSSTKPYPYKMIFPYDGHRGIQYPVTYFLTSLAGFAVVCILFAEDSLFCYFIIFTCSQLESLHSEIQQIKLILIPNENNEKLDFLEESANYQSQCNHQLKSIIKHHSKIINFCEDLENFFSPILLVNFTISSFLICLVGFQLASVKMTIGNFTKLFIYITSVLSQLFVLCWNGDRLMEKSKKTANEFYECGWENLPHGCEFKKKLIFAIANSQYPLKITALKFSILSLQNFTKILSTSMSYFTLLNTLIEDEN